MKLRIGIRRQKKPTVVVALTIALCIFDREAVFRIATRAREVVERTLSLNLGGGDCRWSIPQPLEPLLATYSTLIASYPGSGKRLTYVIMEALTGAVSGDDWDLSQNGDHVIAKKTSYPHPEGAWAWGNTMDQVILQLRNPRWAIPSYMTMRHELQYSQNWTESFGRKEFVYTERPSQAEWEIWRDLKFNTELDRWGWVIDFWMGNGHRRNDGDGNAYQDENCGTNIADCRPVVIIAFEKLYDPISGVEETTRLAQVMNHEETPLIEEDTWPCVFEKTMGNQQPGFKLNANRAGESGVLPFTLQQLRIIKTELERVKTEYSESGWSLNEAAADIVGYMDHYIADIDSEIATL